MLRFAGYATCVLIIVFTEKGEKKMPLDPKKLINNLQKRHKLSEEFSDQGLSKLVICTEGRTSKGAGILEQHWEIEPDGIWISEGHICIFLKPDASLVSHKLDRYANEIFEERKVEVIKRNKKP